MQITRSEEYGLKGLVFLARQPREKMALVSEISRDQGIPEKFLAKIFQRLSRAGLLRSTRGAKGGFSLGRPANEITLREIIEAIEGPVAVSRCFLKNGICDEEDFCPLRDVLQEAQESLLGILSKTTVEDLVKRTVEKANRKGGDKS
jgi:Rrf2 family iron-sulfur cluster assembly transcriptional regulator